VRAVRLDDQPVLDASDGQAAREGAELGLTGNTENDRERVRRHRAFN
jgi:hypothetical protein